ncbi:DUF1615 domain-containing protein [Marilutibacter aestuarii]
MPSNDPVPARALRAVMLLATVLALAACASGPASKAGWRPPAEVRAEIARRMPAGVADREGWAADIQVAFAAQGLVPDAENLCAVLAVTQQESSFQANPPVPGLARIARGEIDRRAADAHVPGFLVDAALKVKSGNGRSYAERLAAVRTEQELNAIFEDFTRRVPMGERLLGGFNPVRTGGPMQVSIAFAEAHADGYPWPLEGSIRDEVFTRRGGMYFGIAHLLGYPTRYERPLYRFADFNAGWHASRNAAFQAAVTEATGIGLALDGDLLRPGAPLDAPGSTERAVRVLGPRLGLDDRAIRRALERGDRLEFEDEDLYRGVFALAEQARGGPLPRAVLPGIKLESPKITRELTTAWFANRVDTRWRQCMAR